MQASILSFGDELENEKWDLEVEGSAFGGRGFVPCSYLKIIKMSIKNMQQQNSRHNIEVILYQKKQI